MSKHINITKENEFSLPIGTATVMDEVADILIANGEAYVTTELPKPIVQDTPPVIIVKEEQNQNPKPKNKTGPRKRPLKS